MDLRKLLSGSGDPHRILKIVLSFSIVMLFLWLLMVSRMDYGTGEDAHSETVRTESENTLRSITGIREQSGSPGGDRSSPNIFMNALTTFLVMGTILAVIWLWSRSRSGDKVPSNRFRDLGEHHLGHDKSLKVVEINNEIWVLGLSSGTVSLLHRYSADEWKDKIVGDDKEESNFYKLFSGKT